MTPPDDTLSHATDADANASSVHADAPPSLDPAADLSGLRERAESALSARRESRRGFETSIEAELDELAKELARELEKSRDEARQEAERLAGEEARQQAQQQFAKQQAELDAEQQEINDQRSALEEQRKEFEEQRKEWEGVCSQVEQNLADQEERIVQRERDAEQAVAAAKQEQRELDRWAGELADERLAIEALRRDAPAANGDDQSAALESETQAKLQAANDRADKAIAERDTLAEDLRAAERASAASASALETDNQTLRERIDELESRPAPAETDEQNAADWEQERTALMDSLAAAADELERVREVGETTAAELRGKFDLAQADVERLRSRVDEQDQELSERAAAGAGESAELAQLRCERDDLAEQLEEARAAATGSPPEANQEVDDLRRRFELAVEDVRQLKTENAELEERLANSAGAASNGGAMDWEAQKRRMLAELEGEAPPEDESQQQERATIEGTIRITDEVVAEKDREIAQLRSQLESAPAAGVADAGDEAPPENPLSDDERLAAERERLAELEEEWRKKLRAAELEVSVERAKIAREQAELAEWRIELESMRNAAGGDNAGAPGKGQRRWLDKLGLGGE